MPLLDRIQSTMDGERITIRTNDETEVEMAARVPPAESPATARVSVPLTASGFAATHSTAA